MLPDEPHPAKPKVEQDPRVIFAAERTLLAWIRTGLALMGFGFVVARFGLLIAEMAAASLGAPGTVHLPPDPSRGQVSLWIGVILVVTGVAMNLMATVAHVRTMHRLRDGVQITPDAWSAATVLAILLAAMGLGMAGYLLFVR